MRKTRLRPGKSFALKSEKVTKSHLEKLLFDNCWKEREFSRRLWPLVCELPYREGHTSKSTWASQTVLDEFSLKKKRGGGTQSRVAVEGEVGLEKLGKG